MMSHTRKQVLVPFDKYQRLLQKNPDSTQPTELPQPDASKALQSERSSTKIDKLIPFFPKLFQRKARNLLEYVNQSKDLNWNDNGELVIRGKKLPHSHIIDIIKDALVHQPNFKPVGLESFYRNLDNIPLTLITNQHRRHLVHSAENESVIIPPPGVPYNKKSRPLDKKSIPLNKKSIAPSKLPWKTIK